MHKKKPVLRAAKPPASVSGVIDTLIGIDLDAIENSLTALHPDTELLPHEKKQAYLRLLMRLGSLPQPGFARLQKMCKAHADETLRTLTKRDVCGAGAK